jgi:hypothetical protein
MLTRLDLWLRAKSKRQKGKHVRKSKSPMDRGIEDQRQLLLARIETFQQQAQKYLDAPNEDSIAEDNDSYVSDDDSSVASQPAEADDSSEDEGAGKEVDETGDTE